ncbi:hypothetical protein SALBM311S_00892 [Streptomyces alboniger]
MSVRRSTRLSDAARSFRAAARVAEAALPGGPLPEGRTFHELSDIGLRRHAVRAARGHPDQAFAERQLGRLIEHDARPLVTDLLSTLRHYLDAAGNKTTTARLGALSRETVYQRLRTIERLLDRDLESRRAAHRAALWRSRRSTFSGWADGR